MSTNIKYFSVPDRDGNNELLLMPKLKYRFRVIFDGLGSQESISGANPLQLTRQVIDVTRPVLDMPNQTIDIYNSRLNYAGRPIWSEITISLRDDIKSETTLAIASQMRMQFNFIEQISALSGSNYKFTTIIEMLDGGNGDGTTGGWIGREAQVLERWECVGCYIRNVSYGDMAYSSQEHVQIKLSIQPDNCEQYIDGIATSGNTVSNTSPQEGKITAQQTQGGNGTV